MSPGSKEVFSALLGTIVPVFELLSGGKLPSYNVDNLPTPDFVDLKGNVLGLFDAFVATDNPIEKAWYLYQLSIPFHVAGKEFFESSWHTDFNNRLIEDCKKLPFIYHREMTVGNGSIPTKKDLFNYMNRIMLERTKNFIEAYKYGNGYPVLFHHILPTMWDNMCNSILGILLLSTTSR